MSASIVLLDPSDQAVITIDWSDALDSNSLVSVVHVVPSPLAKMSEATDIPGKASQVKVPGAVHGGIYLIEGQATLSNGEILNRQFPARCFNG